MKKLTKSIRLNQPQRGATLIEVLVATAVLAVAFAIALVIYNASRQSFKKGENASETQQGVRLAYDAMVADLRMAGYNSNPDGSSVRLDEAIEGTFATAITVRADFDANDPTDSVDPETTLEGGAFLAVSTGNDEIVTYVLAKPDGSDTGSVAVDVDVSEVPRDGDVETVTINNVATTHDNPPYTLYRITFNNDETTFGSANFIQRVPVIDNVRSMNFTYYDTAGNDISTTVIPLGGVDNINARAQRGQVSRIGIELVGMTPDPDPQYVDPDETIASAANHRKFLISGDVTPRNFGMKGQRDLFDDVTPPSQPATPNLLAGHCGGVFVTWTANPTSDEVAFYRLSYGDDATAADEIVTSATTSRFVTSLNDATPYYFKLVAVDAAGNPSVPSATASITTTNVNTPSTPQNLTASTGLDGAIRLQWDAVTENTTSDPAADPQAPRIRDLAGYRINRSSAAGTGPQGIIADESVVTPRPNPNYADTQTIACEPYSYEVHAVDACGVMSGASATVTGSATTSVAPMAPQNVQAFYGAPGEIVVSWDAVDRNVNGDPAFIQQYDLYRTTPYDPALGIKPTTFLPPITISGGATTYTDTVGIGFAARYYVVAKDSCPNYSADSEITEPSCAFGGDVVILSPQDESPVAGVVPVEVEVQNPTDPEYRLELTFTLKSTGDQTVVDVGDSGTPSWTYNWLADPPGPYTITASVTNDQGCTKSTSIDVAAGFDVGCCLSPPNPDADPVLLGCAGGRLKCRLVGYNVINNNCLTAVAIEEINITWSDDLANNPLLQEVSFDGTPIWAVTQNASSPAYNSFDNDGNGQCDVIDNCPSIDISRDTTNPVLVSYLYSEIMGESKRGVSIGNYLTTTYRYRLLDADGNPTSITGACGPATGMFGNLVVDP